MSFLSLCTSMQLHHRQLLLEAESSSNMVPKLSRSTGCRLYRQGMTRGGQSPCPVTLPNQVPLRNGVMPQGLSVCNSGTLWLWECAQLSDFEVQAYLCALFNPCIFWMGFDSWSLLPSYHQTRQHAPHALMLGSIWQKLYADTQTLDLCSFFPSLFSPFDK